MHAYKLIILATDLQMEKNEYYLSLICETFQYQKKINIPEIKGTHCAFNHFANVLRLLMLLKFLFDLRV